MNCSTPGLPVHHQLPEFTQIHVHRVSDAIQPSHPRSSPSPPAPNPSQHQRLFQWVNSSHEVAKSFSFSIIPSKEIPGLISFRMDWMDVLAVQGTLKSLLQHHSSKASVLQRSAFFIVQLSHPYMTTGKTMALTRLTFVDKVMSLLFNMLSRLVITFLSRSKRLLISWLQFDRKVSFASIPHLVFPVSWKALFYFVQDGKARVTKIFEAGEAQVTWVWEFSLVSGVTGVLSTFLCFLPCWRFCGLTLTQT